MEMPKAYDKMSLIVALEKKGIVGGIQMVKDSMAVLQEWLASSAALSTEGFIGKFDDMAVKGESIAFAFINGKLDELGVSLTPVIAPVAPIVEAPAPTPAVDASAPTSPEPSEGLAPATPVASKVAIKSSK